MSNSLALAAEPLRSGSSALAGHAASTDALHGSVASAWSRLDGGWQSYAREDVDAHMRNTTDELARMRRMLSQLEHAARSSDEIIAAADADAAALFTASASSSFVDDWLDWLWSRLRLGIHITEIPLPTPTPPIIALSITQIGAVFADMADEADIPFAFPADGCYARADVMVHRIAARYGIDIDAIKKVVIRGDLRVPTTYVYQGPYGNDEEVVWNWHIAPAVPVRGDDGVIRYAIIDPALFDHPVTMQEWAAAMSDPRAEPHIVNRHVYGLDDLGKPIFLDDAAARAESRWKLDDFLSHCVARGYCKTKVTPEDLEILRQRCVDAGYCIQNIP